MGPKNTWNALQITLVLNSLLNGICHLILQHLSCLSFNHNQTFSACTETWDRESDVCPRRARNRADGRRAPKCRADQNEGLVRMPKILCCESLRICSVKSSQLTDKRWKSRWHWLHQLPLVSEFRDWGWSCGELKYTQAMKMKHGPKMESLVLSPTTGNQA